jgi:hypothetical protein
MQKKTKRIIAASLALMTFLGSVFAVSASASFGGGAMVMAKSENLIKTGLFGKKLVFSDTDFKQGLTVTDFDSVTITKIPPTTEGSLLLAGRRVSEGMTIRRKNLGALVFIPSDKNVKESSFKFKISPYADGNELEFKLKFTDKINYEPELEDASPTSILTQRDITIYGKMKASDKEGDEITYKVVAYPKYGTLEVLDAKNGEFRYTPLKGYVGEDEFSYVARDTWGNYSVPGKINVNVSARLSEIEYRDMKNNESYNAAVALSAMGIMDGKILGDGVYFRPEECVSRAEFVSMVMKALDIKADTTVTESFFDDNAYIPTGLVSYIGTAERIGLITGKFENGRLIFAPNESITSSEAASIVRRALGDKIDGEAPDYLESELPVYLREDAYILCSLGIFEKDFSEMKKDELLTKAECASILYKLINM